VRVPPFFVYPVFGQELYISMPGNICQYLFRIFSKYFLTGAYTLIIYKRGAFLYQAPRNALQTKGMFRDFTILYRYRDSGIFSVIPLFFE